MPLATRILIEIEMMVLNAIDYDKAKFKLFETVKMRFIKYEIIKMLLRITVLKLDDIKILIEKQNLKLKSMTQKEKLIRNLAVYGFIVVIMLLGILLPFILIDG